MGSTWRKPDEYRDGQPAKAATATQYHIWYDTIIDWLLLNPTRPLKDLAAEIGYSGSHLSYLMRSDAFMAVYTRRRQEVNARVADAIVHQLGKVALKSTELLAQRLERQDESRTKTDDLVKIMDSSLTKLGYGAPKGVGVVINNVNSQVVDTGVAQSGVVEAMREAIRAEQVKREATLDLLADLRPEPPERPGEVQPMLPFEEPERPASEIDLDDIADADEVLFGSEALAASFDAGRA